MTEEKQKERNERIGRIVNNVSQLPDEEQIYVLGNVEGLVAKKTIERKRSKKPKGAQLFIKTVKSQKAVGLDYDQLMKQLEERGAQEICQKLY